MPPLLQLDAFTRAYLTAALWTEDPSPGQGEYQEHDDWTIGTFHAVSHIPERCAYQRELATEAGLPTRGRVLTDEDAANAR